MKSRCTIAALTCCTLLIAIGSTAAKDRLSLRVTPNVSNAPSTVVVMATVEPNADNRWLHVEADSGVFLRASDVQLDGDNAPMISEFRLNNLPSGEYTVTAVLKTNRGQETVVRRTAIVLPRVGEPGR